MGKINDKLVIKYLYCVDRSVGAGQQVCLIAWERKLGGADLFRKTRFRQSSVAEGTGNLEDSRQVRMGPVREH